MNMDDYIIIGHRSYLHIFINMEIWSMICFFNRWNNRTEHPCENPRDMISDNGTDGVSKCYFAEGYNQQMGL